MMYDTETMHRRPEFAQYQSFVDNYNTYKHKIYNYFYFRCGQNRVIAEDLTSDTFVKAYENIDNYNEQFAFSTWIYAIARNTLTDHFRRSAYRDTEGIDEDRPDENAEYFIDTLDQHIDIERVRTAMKQLPEMQRTTIAMRYFEHLEIADIANSTNSDQNAVRKNISRGLQRLRALLVSLILLIHI